MDNSKHYSPEEKCRDHDKKYTRRCAAIRDQPVHHVRWYERSNDWNEDCSGRDIEDHRVEKRCKCECERETGDGEDRSDEDRSEEAHSEFPRLLRV